MSPPSLESCIASSLVSDDIKSSDLAKLITETEGAIAAADKAAEEERERALDPIASPARRRHARPCRRPNSPAIA